MIWRAHVARADGATEWRTLEAPSRDAAASRLLVDGVLPLDLRTDQPGFVDLLNRPISFSFGLPVTEQALFLRQIATLVGSGIPVDRALDLLAEQSSHRALRSLLAGMVKHVRQGGGLSTAIEKSAGFPAYVTGVIRAAERGGRLGVALGSLAERLELAAATRRQLVTALSYPIAILVATVGALLLVLVGVVPQFAPLFEGEEERLPLLTRAVLALSSLAIDHSWELSFLIVGLFLIGLIAIKVPSVRRAIAPLAKWLPFASLRNQYLAAQFSSLLGTLLSNGLTLASALPLVRGAIGSERWSIFLSGVEQRVRAGHSISAALSSGDLVPGTVIRLIEVGEKTGQLAETSLQAGRILSEAARARIERIVALVNPVAIILLGGMVGALVAGVMLGIFAMGDFAG